MRAVASMFLWSLGLLSVAQENAPVFEDQPWSIGARGQFGFLWPHRPSAWILVEGHASAVELFAERRVKGDRPWHQFYLLPSYGVAVLYTGMADPDKIGAGVRVLPYLFLPFTRGERSTFGMRVGWGLGYIAKPYDRRENGKQIAIGSRLNMAIHLMPEYRYARERWIISTGLGIDHWSNGSYQLPNLGLNYVSVSVAASYALAQRPADPIMDRMTVVLPRGPQYSVVGAFGINETGGPLRGQYSVYVLSGEAQWWISRKSKLSAGADLFNKGSLASLHPELKDSERLALTQAALHGGYALGFGRGDLFFHMGAYVYTPKPDEAPVFHRVGMRYRTGEHLLWNISLKSHYAVADHIEFGVGYRW